MGSCPKLASINALTKYPASALCVVSDVFLATSPSEGSSSCLAILDSACQSSVCGQRWFEQFSQATAALGIPITVVSKRMDFAFGKDVRSARESFAFTIRLFDEVFTVHVAVVSENEGDRGVPLLLSRSDQFRLRLIVDHGRELALQAPLGEQCVMPALGSSLTFSGRAIPLVKAGPHLAIDLKPLLTHTSTDHPCFHSEAFACGPAEQEVFAVMGCESVFLQEALVPATVALLGSTVDPVLLESRARKLHHVFAHASAGQLLSLCRTAGVHSKQLKAIITKICSSCIICKRTGRAGQRSRVAIPLATSFNEGVALDVVSHDGSDFLLMTCLGTRYLQASYVQNKST